MSGIQDWLRERKYFRKFKGDREYTHTFLTSGVADVPDASHSVFNNAYANAIVRGDTPSLSERRTPVFRLFADLDVKLAKAEDDAKLHEVLADIASRTSSFFDVEDDSAGVVVLRAPLDTVKGQLKSGTHLVWPDVYVTSATALAFREFVIEGLASRFGLLFENDWSSIVDKVVYESAGLRMPWSHKGDKGARPYVPTATILPDGSWSEVDLGPKLTAPVVQAWVRRTVIRAPGALPTKLNEGIVVPAASPVSAGRALSESLSRYAPVLKAVQGALAAQYVDQRFIGVVRLSNSFVLRSSSKYCANLGGEHSQSNVYFLLTRRGVQQRCYCRNAKVDGRKYGPCRKYRGPVRPVPKAVIEAFFDEDDALEMIEDEGAAKKSDNSKVEAESGTGSLGASKPAGLKRSASLQAIVDMLRRPWQQPKKARGRPKGSGRGNK